MLVKKLLDDNFGSIVVSVILGLGLAALFRKACSGDGCIVVKAPKAADVNRYYYKIDADCFKYSPEVVPCPSSGDEVGVSE
jgi:hypothetical protein